MTDGKTACGASETVELIQEIGECEVGERVQITDLPNAEKGQSPLPPLFIFDMFGFINLCEGDSGKWTITIEHKSQQYFLRSIAQFIDEDLTIFRSWDEGRKDLITPANIFYGTQFLHYLEKEREEALPDPKPLRKGTVVKAIIKADFDYKKGSRYLFEYDRKAEQYKLIGGLVENPDVSNRKALEREIDEEIPRLDLELGEDYHLKHLDEFENDVVSFTYGAYSTYTIHYYLVDFEEDVSLNLTQQNTWLTMGEIRDCQSKNGNEVFPLELEVMQLLERQPISLEVPATFNPVSFVKSYWQEITGLVSIVSLIIAISRLVL